jgi:hypothetical protein
MAEASNWSGPIQAPSDALNIPHIMQVSGGPNGIAYVAWLTSSTPAGYSLFVGEFAIRGGWQSAPFQVSTQYGDTSVWPGDTIGVSTVAPGRVALSWGSATSTTGKKSEIFAATVLVQ